MYLSVRACAVWGLSNQSLTKQNKLAILFLVDIYFFRTGIRIYLQPGTYVCVFSWRNFPTRRFFLLVLLHDRHAFGYLALWFPFLLALLNASHIARSSCSLLGWALCVPPQPFPANKRIEKKSTQRSRFYPTLI